MKYKWLFAILVFLAMINSKKVKEIIRKICKQDTIVFGYCYAKGIITDGEFEAIEGGYYA